MEMKGRGGKVFASVKIKSWVWPCINVDFCLVAQCFLPLSADHVCAVFVSLTAHRSCFLFLFGWLVLCS